MNQRAAHSLGVLTFLIFAAQPQFALAQSAPPARPAPAASAEPSSTTWNFAVSGDSRNCGDVTMPAIAAKVAKDHAGFYWHLGDFRKLSDFDEDMQHQPKNIASPLSISTYLATAWDDFLQNQIATFAPTPVFLGIGNHELVWPHTREMYLIQFADWLDTPVLRDQRLADDKNNHKLVAYFHWIQGGIDFISLDNATDDAFDPPQVLWFERTLKLAAANPSIHTVVVGMHEALPDSISSNHAMDESEPGIVSGRRVYRDLLALQNDSHKRVYVLASHSHYYMDNIFETADWKDKVLPGWIIGTGGAQRHKLPPEATPAQHAQTNVYGYMIANVTPDGEVSFAFERLSLDDIRAISGSAYPESLVRWCYENNHQ
jgi:hypothetical protein